MFSFSQIISIHIYKLNNEIKTLMKNNFSIVFLKKGKFEKMRINCSYIIII